MPAIDILDSINQKFDNTGTDLTADRVQDALTQTNTKIDNHKTDVANPHAVTKAQVGLSNVDNTSDLNKPISTATQTALDGKVDDAQISNMDNTSDLSKPISTATQTALDAKVDDAQVLTNVPAGAVFTDTVYSHPLDGVDPGAALTGAVVFSDITVNSAGHVTGSSTRILTPASIGAEPALGFTPENSANKGANNGYAELDGSGKVPSAQLPSFVDDVLEYANLAGFPGTGEAGKVYIAIDTNITYRWSGSVYTPIGSDLALGETSTTAYRGDRGKIAYDHSQLVAGNPHGVTQTDVGLGNVDNTSDANKPVSTAQQTALDAKVNNSQVSSTYGNDTVVQRSAAGHIYGNHINMTGSCSQTDYVSSPMAHFVGVNSLDNFARSFSAAAARTLLNVEDGATADQTKADIDALGINADQVDGIEASQFVRSDVANSSGITLDDGGSDTPEIQMVDSINNTIGYLDVAGERIRLFGSYRGAAAAEKFHVDINTGDITAVGKVVCTDVELEGGNHKITANDGGGNFNIRVGNDFTTGCTENGYVSHWNYTQATGQWVFETSTASLLVGNTPTWQNNLILNQNGDLTALGDVSGNSDRRLKTNIEKIENALEKVMLITGYTFDRIDVDRPRQAGVMAQDMLKALPEVVGEDPNGMLTVAYGNMMGLVIEAIKELKSEVDELKSK